MFAALALRRAHRDALNELLLGKQEDNQNGQRRERRAAARPVASVPSALVNACKPTSTGRNASELVTR